MKWIRLLKANKHKEMTLQLINDDSKHNGEYATYELDGVQFTKTKEETLENAISVCLETDFADEWEKEGIFDFTIESVNYEEGDEFGTVMVQLED